MMKSDELRKLSKDDLNKELNDLLREKFNLRMMLGSGQDVKPHLLNNVRKRIARVKTVITENSKKID